MFLYIGVAGDFLINLNKGKVVRSLGPKELEIQRQLTGMNGLELEARGSQDSANPEKIVTGMRKPMEKRLKLMLIGLALSTIFLCIRWVWICSSTLFIEN